MRSFPSCAPAINHLFDYTGVCNILWTGHPQYDVLREDPKGQCQAVSGVGNALLPCLSLCRGSSKAHGKFNRLTHSHPQLPTISPVSGNKIIHYHGCVPFLIRPPPPPTPPTHTHTPPASEDSRRVSYHAGFL